MEKNIAPQSVIAYLSTVETYDASMQRLYPFRRGTDVIEGHAVSVGNMVGGFPMELCGVKFHGSEQAYIAMAFSDGSERHRAIQQALVEQTNGFMAKKKERRFNEDCIREDWRDGWNFMAMLWVVWNKCMSNAEFRNVLFSLPSDCIIIENSSYMNGTTSSIWGAKNMVERKLSREYAKELKAQGLGKAAVKRALDEKRLGEWRKVGCFVGKNVMGKILMLCRDALRNGTEPPIDYNLLQSKHIHLLGKEIDFGHGLQAAA